MAEHGDNKAAVARMLDVTDVTIGYWIRRERWPSEPTIDAIVRRLRIRRDLDREGGNWRDYVQPLPARLVTWRKSRPDVTDAEAEWLARMPGEPEEWRWAAAIELFRGGKSS